MGRLTPPEPPWDPSGEIAYADGYTPCPRCGERPPAGDPWTRIHAGTFVFHRACLDCALKYDDGFQPREDM